MKAFPSPVAKAGFAFLEPMSAPGELPRDYLPRLCADAKDIRLTLLSNGFVDSDVFLADCGRELRGHLSIGEVREFAKSDMRASAVLMTAEQLDALAATSDVVVAGIGHCGGCTTSITRAVCGLADRGIPVVVMVTERFANSAAFTAGAAGVPEVPVVLVPHPIAGQSAEFHRSVAEVVAPRLVAALRQGRGSDAPISIVKAKVAA